MKCSCQVVWCRLFWRPALEVNMLLSKILQGNFSIHTLKSSVILRNFFFCDITGCYKMKLNTSSKVQNYDIKSTLINTQWKHLRVVASNSITIIFDQWTWYKWHIYYQVLWTFGLTQNKTKTSIPLHSKVPQNSTQKRYIVWWSRCTFKSTSQRLSNNH